MNWIRNDWGINWKAFLFSLYFKDLRTGSFLVLTACFPSSQTQTPSAIKIEKISRKSSFPMPHILKIIKFSLGALVSFFVSYLTYRVRNRQKWKRAKVAFLHALLQSMNSTSQPTNKTASLKTIWYFFFSFWFFVAVLIALPALLACFFYQPLMMLLLLLFVHSLSPHHLCSFLSFVASIQRLTNDNSRFLHCIRRKSMYCAVLSLLLTN